MGAKTTAPRNLIALAGIWLQGTVPSSLGRDTATHYGSQSPASMQGWGTNNADRH